MKKIITTVLFAGPLVAFASGSFSGISALVTGIQTIVNYLVPVMVTLAIVVFFWGLVKYISNASDEAAKEGGKTLMIWGMIAIFVMVALWSILGWLQSNLGISGNSVTNTAPPAFQPPIRGN